MEGASGRKAGWRTGLLSWSGCRSLRPGWIPRHVSDRCVLVVDDDEGVRYVLREALRDEGYEVIEATDGASALAKLAERAPMLIVLDLMMPGLDGWSFRVRQRELNLAMSVPVLLLSASRQVNEVQGFGAAAVMVKPFDIEELLALVASLQLSSSA